MIAPLLLLLLVSTGPVQLRGTYSAAANFSTDIEGVPDTRPGTWGTAGSDIHKIVFDPPAGYRVRMLRVYGDFVIWPRHKVPAGTTVGALFALQLTAPEGSIRADLAADNTFVYLQVATAGDPVRAPFDFECSDGGLLEPDNVLEIKFAVFLNETGQKIHMETSFVIVYRFEKES